MEDITLSDPHFGRPGRIDLLLGVDVFVEVLMHGQRTGPLGTPIAFETLFGWVLAGKIDANIPDCNIDSHHVSFITGDDLLNKFWEIEEHLQNDLILSPEERSVVSHFRDNHTRSDSGRFVVPLPKRLEAKLLGESRSQAVRRFLLLERALHSRNLFEDFNAVMQEYFDMGHAENVPEIELEKSPRSILPPNARCQKGVKYNKKSEQCLMHLPRLRLVCLYDTLLIGPTVHPPLFDVLRRF